MKAKIKNAKKEVNKPVKSLVITCKESNGSVSLEVKTANPSDKKFNYIEILGILEQAKRNVLDEANQPRQTVMVDLSNFVKNKMTEISETVKKNK